MSFLSIVIVLVACQGWINPVQAEGATLKGYVKNGNSSMGFSRITLYRAGSNSARGTGATVLGKTTANSVGEFTLSYDAPKDSNTVLYLIASGPGVAIKLASVLGTVSVHSLAVVNERTTVATAYAMAQFIRHDQIGGTFPGLQNAAANLQNLVNITNGNIGHVLDRYPNGVFTPTRKKFNSLANMIAACIGNPTLSSVFFALSPSPQNDIPSNTLDAMVNIAHTTWREQTITALYDFSMGSSLYGPVLTSAPDHWALAIRYAGNGQELDGPGNISFDADGNAWVANNYSFSLDPLDENVCGGRQLLRFTPRGDDYPGAPYEGGGVYGAGFGVTVDKKGYAWVGNFAFQGSGCQNDQSDYWDTVSRFNSKGEANPKDAIFSDNDAQPQGMVSDRDGSVWVANCRAGSVTRFVGGDPDSREIYGTGVFDRPFDVSIDPNGMVWVTNNNSHKVYMIDPSNPGAAPKMVGTPSFFQRPMGIAGDSQGNMWVSNSGALPAPCGGSDTPQTLIDFLKAIGQDAQVDGASVTMLTPDGQVAAGSPFTQGGLYMPWGIAVDGADNVLVANFTGKRLGFLCGANPENCPPGFTTGQPLSPGAGYTFDGLARTTGVQVDPSGNVWLVNNWEMVPFPQNPGGHYLTVFIGLAAPVKTPLLGPPRTP